MIALDIAASVLLCDQSGSSRSAIGDMHGFGSLMSSLLGDEANSSVASRIASSPAALLCFKLSNSCKSKQPPKIGYVLRTLRKARTDISERSNALLTDDALCLVESATAFSAISSTAVSFVSSAIALAAAPIGWLSSLVSNLAVDTHDIAWDRVKKLHQAVKETAASVMEVFATLPGPAGWDGFTRAGGPAALHKVLTAHYRNVEVALCGCAIAEHIPQPALVQSLCSIIRHHVVAPGTDVLAAACRALLACAKSPCAQSDPTLFKLIAAPVSVAIRVLAHKGADDALMHATKLVGAVACLRGSALDSLISAGVVRNLVDAGHSASPTFIPVCLDALSAIAISGGARHVAVGGAALAAKVARGKFECAADSKDTLSKCGIMLLVNLARSSDHNACEAAAAVGCVPLFLASGSLDNATLSALAGLICSEQVAAVARESGSLLALADIMSSCGSSTDDREIAAQAVYSLLAYFLSSTSAWDHEAVAEHLLTCLAMHNLKPRIELLCTVSLSRLVLDLRVPGAAVRYMCDPRVMSCFVLAVQHHRGGALVALEGSAYATAAQALARIAIEPALNRAEFVKVGGVMAMTSVLRNWKRRSEEVVASQVDDVQLPATLCFDAIGAMVSSSVTPDVCAGIDAGALEWSMSSARGAGPGTAEAGLTVLARLTLWAVEIKVVDSTLLDSILVQGGVDVMSRALSETSASKATFPVGSRVYDMCTRAIAANIYGGNDVIALDMGILITSRLETVAKEISSLQPTYDGAAYEGMQGSWLSAEEVELQWIALCKAVHCLAMRDDVSSGTEHDSVESGGYDRDKLTPLSSALGPAGGSIVTVALKYRTLFPLQLPAADVDLLEALRLLLARPPDYASAVDSSVICILHDFVHSQPPVPLPVYASVADCLKRLAVEDSFPEHGGLAACVELLRVTDNTAAAADSVGAILSSLGVELGSPKPQGLEGRVCLLLERVPLIALQLVRCLDVFKLERHVVEAVCTLFECISGTLFSFSNPTIGSAQLVVLLRLHPESAALATSALPLLSRIISGSVPPDIPAALSVIVASVRKFAGAQGWAGRAVAESGSQIIETLVKLARKHPSTPVTGDLSACITEALAVAASVHSGSLVVAISCCSALPLVVSGMMEADDASEGSPSADSASVIAPFFEAGGCAALSNALFTHAARMPAQIVSAACEALVVLADLCRHDVYEAGAVRAAVAAIQKHPKNASVASNALQLLLSLFSGISGGHGHAMDKRILSVVCLALSDNAENPRASACGVGLIGHVLDGSPARSAFALSAGAAAALVRSLTLMPSSSGIYSCFKALHVLSCTHPKAVIASQAPQSMAQAIAMWMNTSKREGGCCVSLCVSMSCHV